MRIIFVGLHNKPHMAPLDSGTKTGKLVDRIIKELPKGTEVVKTNILDVEELVPSNQFYKYVNEWYWTNLPVHDDIIVLLGALTQDIHGILQRPSGKIIRVAHPASKRSHVSMDEYVKNVSEKIINTLQVKQ